MRDKRKTNTSACANFIHQKDAYIAFNLLYDFYTSPLLDERIPMYTVHDNFITTPPFAGFIPKAYCQAILKMGHPLLIINDFIFHNLVKPYYESTKMHPIHIHDNLKETPISIKDLHEFLISISPTKDKKKRKEKCDERKAAPYTYSR